MTRDFDIIEDIIASIYEGTYDIEPHDLYVINCCAELGAEAEIFTALNPDKAVTYLMKRKVILYRIMACVAEEKERVELWKKLQLEFVEDKLIKLYQFYLNLLEDIKDL